MEDNVEYLPVWKMGQSATAEDRFQELALMARKHPERFQKVCVSWNYEVPGDPPRVQTNYAVFGCNTLELLGLLELVKEEILDETRR